MTHPIVEQLIGTAIAFVVIYGLYLIYWHRYKKHVVKLAGESANAFNDKYQTDYTDFEFVRIEEKNPGWLGLSSEKQYELFKEHDGSLFCTCCYIAIM